MKTLKLLAVSALLSASTGVHAGYVDLFTQGQDDIFIDNSPSTAPTGTPVNIGDTSGTSISAYSSSIIGGYRVLNMTGTSFAGTSLTYNGSMGVDTVLNRLNLSTSTGVAAVGTVQWSGFAGFQDLTNAGSTLNLATNLLSLGDALSYTTFAVDLDTFFTVNFYSASNKWTSIKIKTDGPGSDTIALTAAAAPIPGFFVGNNGLCGVGLTPAQQAATSVYEVNCAGGGVDLTNVNALELVYNVAYNGSALTQALDLSIGPIKGTVPEPSVIALMGIGLLSAGFISARRRDNTLQA